jgi:phenylacetate-CoA ligase
MSQFRFLEETQWWERDRLVMLQSRNLIETIETAYRYVPFYRELYDKQRVDVGTIRSVKDLSRVPIVTKDMLRGAYPDKCTREVGSPYREYFTSGSTGRPFAVRVDNYTMSIARALMFLRASFSGWAIGDRYLQTGMTLDRGWVKWLKDAVLRVQYVSAYDLSDSALDRYLEVIDDRKLKYVMGYAASIYFLAKRAKQVSFNESLRGVVSWGDNMYPHYRRQIEDQFKCRVTDTYGCGEGIQVAAQCSEGNYHIFMPHVAVEIVRDGQPCEESEIGEIVLTRLNPGAMPLIRYRVGDVGRSSASKTCTCGRGFEQLSCIEGRDSDIVLTPNGKRLIVHFFTGIFEYATSIDTFQVVQEELGSVIVRIVPGAGFCKEQWERVKGEIMEKGDPDLGLNLEVVNEIPLEKSNKRRFVISRLEREQFSVV